MRVNIFNKEIVKEGSRQCSLPFTWVKKGYKYIFREYPLTDVNIVFVRLGTMRILNKRYRNIDSPTDVLSFSMSSSSGEVYICPEYVGKSFKGSKFDEEILRLIIHGTLHILGYDHKDSLNDNPEEEMFKLQEDLVVKYIEYVHSHRGGKSRKRV